jgi:hypothetical protein
MQEQGMGWQRTFWLWLVLVLVVIGSVPRVQAQEAGPLYFPATGHTLNDSVGFLSFWQAHNGETLLGLPVSEPLTSEAGTSQYFERGRLEQQLDVASGVSTVVVGAVAREYTAALYRTFASLPPAQSRPECAILRKQATPCVRHSWPSGRLRRVQYCLGHRYLSRYGKQPVQGAARCSILPMYGLSAMPV